ncbi:unnamed protein product [Echinostoma caproni]|uniref:PDZ domain-containing protein n=1 Tax=Echinostoma caproni TaxID=27848 RepID=A0A183AAC1_9TREM|nr:unnamed protein product [Echinostoma caproni]
MSDTETNQPEAAAADVVIADVEGGQSEVEEEEAVPSEQKKSEEDQEKVEQTVADVSEEEKPEPDETIKSGGVESEPETKATEVDHDAHEQPVVSEKSSTPEAEDKQATAKVHSSSTEQLITPIEQNKELSGELEYEPLLDEQTVEEDEKKASETSTTSAVEGMREAHVPVTEREEAPDEYVEPEKIQSVSEKRQIFETPVVPATAMKPRTEALSSVSVKRQVSWEPRVETITVDQSQTTAENAGQVAYNAVPSRISYPSGQSVANTADQMSNMSINTDYPAPRRTKAYQSALYRRQPVSQQSSQPFYVKPSYCIAPQSVPSTPNPPPVSRDSGEAWNHYPNQALPLSVPPQPVIRSVPAQIQTAPQQNYPAATPARKISGTPPYVGSQVIATNTGPSSTVLLRRPVSERHWGFTFFGGSENGCPPFVNKVTSGSLAAQHGMEVGDVIVSICNSLTVGKTQEQLKADILRAGNELDLVLIKRGVDLDKIAQLAPKALPTTPRSPPPGATAYPDRQFSFPGPGVVARSPRVEPAISRGRSFRSIKTKSIRILEEQLASGQSPSSVVHTKQHFQGARGLPASGTPSSYMRAYGQNPNQGYLGRSMPDSTGQNEPGWTGRETVVPVQAVHYAQPVYAPYEPSYASDRGASRWDQGSTMGQPTWETQSYSGQTSGWAVPTPAHQQPQMAQPPMNLGSPQPVVYPNPSYSPGSVYTASTNISVPVHARPQWPNRS